MKPENLLLAADGTCKIADFGLAKSYGPLPSPPPPPCLFCPAFLTFLLSLSSTPAALCSLPPCRNLGSHAADVLRAVSQATGRRTR